MRLQIFFLLFYFFASFLFAKSGVQTYGELKNDELFVYIINNNPYAITYKYTATYDKLYPMQELPILKSTEANTSELLAKFMVLGGKYQLTNNYSWVLGDKNAKHNDNYLYRLPYAIGETFQVTQGFNGSFSHKGDSQYAIDFGMDIGTKIYASREGVVVMTKNDGYKSGSNRTFAEDANHITIKHDDGTYGKYVHLRRGGVAVEVGQKVNRGDFIGYSGNTGWTNGPHLHFVVFTGKDHRSRNPIPIKFITAQGIIHEPTRGQRYTAVQ